MQLIKLWIIVACLAPDVAYAALRKSKNGIYDFVSRARKAGLNGGVMVNITHLKRCSKVA